MRKTSKVIVSIILLWAILLSNCQVFAAEVVNNIKAVEFSEEFKRYMEMSSEEREKVLMPRMFNIKKSNSAIRNPFKMSSLTGSSLDSKYSLKETIPENMVIKDQNPTGSCWAFGSLAMLESTLALKDYNSGNSAKVYDFSERHMEYSSSDKSFTDGINENGFNREVGSGGGSGLYIPYLTNGTGAVLESALPFEPNEAKIPLSSIQNKEVVTQVNDILAFPSYAPTEDLTQIKQQIKEHIKNYGAIEAGIHGASPLEDQECYNNDTGAIYCNNAEKFPINHSVAIIGWDDDYAKENFVEENRPTSNGAWIIKNSWGTEAKVTLQEAKQLIFEIVNDNGINPGWTSPNDVQDSIAIQQMEELGFTYNPETQEAILKMGDNGFMYVSYQDVNIYSALQGITNAQNGVSYENIYQYDNFGGVFPVQVLGQKIYLATEFDKKTTGDEYLTQIAINASEKYTCKVYVNPNGSDKSINSLQQVELVTGETETIDVGYHTIEFATPVKINSDKFIVVLEAEGENSNAITFLTEFNASDWMGAAVAEQYGLSVFDNVTIANNKCFITTEAGIKANQWDVTSTLKTKSNGELPDGDTTLKAFTVSKVLESIEITTPPAKTKYLLGEDFDATGMIVKANYSDGTSEEITDYEITNGKDLMLNQTSVKIVYKGKAVEQPIEVVQNIVESIKITTPPTKTEYFAGEDFDKTGMVVNAVYTDKTEKQITDYEIEDGESLLSTQTSVTISYEGKTVKQDIVVKANPVTKLEITQEPKKVEYVVGQNFNPEGMVVKATYESGLEKEVKNYTIQNGESLSLEQEEVVIEFEGQTVKQAITVVEKAITGISVKTMPSKTEYLLSEELDLTGGEIEVAFNDDTKETIKMTEEEVTVEGFDSETIGTKTITLTYEGKTTQFEVNVKEIKPENSNFDKARANVNTIKSYNFSDVNQQPYIVVSVEIDNIQKATVNEKMEYYYYVSANPNEENIGNWVKINEAQDAENKLKFDVNSKDIPNYAEIADAEILYIYVKEVAIRNNKSSENVSKSMLLNPMNAVIENYLDGVKVEGQNPGTEQVPGTQPTPNQGNDDTKAPGKIPHAGKGILTICMIGIVLILGRIFYKKYKNIQVK